jgi:hypothetical protein
MQLVYWWCLPNETCSRTYLHFEDFSFVPIYRLNPFLMHSKLLIYSGNMNFQSVSVSVTLSEYVKIITTTWTVTPPGYPNIQRLVQQRSY